LRGKRFKVNSVLKWAILISNFIRSHRLNHRHFLASSLHNVGSEYVKMVPKKCIYTVLPPFSFTVLPFDKVALALM
jgi:hypothetical protein